MVYWSSYMYAKDISYMSARNVYSFQYSKNEYVIKK